MRTEQTGKTFRMLQEVASLVGKEKTIVVVMRYQRHLDYAADRLSQMLPGRPKLNHRRELICGYTTIRFATDASRMKLHGIHAPIYVDHDSELRRKNLYTYFHGVRHR